MNDTIQQPPALVAVIIPVYNSAKVLPQTIRSLAAQTFTDFEVFFVDDCSTDDSLQVIQRETAQYAQLKYYIIQTPQNSGAAQARNLGVSHAQSRYIAFLDADDIWRADKLKNQMTFMLKNKHAFTFTAYEYLTADGQQTGKITIPPPRMTYKQALKNTAIFTSTVILDTAQIKKSDIKMPEVKHEDTALWWSLLKKYPAAYGLYMPLVLYRISPGSLSGNKARSALWAWRLYRENEGFSVCRSLYYFIFYAANAFIRRRLIWTKTL